MSRKSLRIGVLTTLVAAALCFQVGNVSAESSDKPAAAEEESESLLDKMKGMVGIGDEKAAADETKEAASEAKEAASESAASASEAAKSASESAAEESGDMMDKAKTMTKDE